MPIRTQFLWIYLVLQGCGYEPDEPTGFVQRQECVVRGATFRSEIPVDCQELQVELDAALAVTSVLGPKPPELHVYIWNRSVLACRQYFLGACVYFVKGEESGRTHPVVDLSSGRELLAHELIHYYVPGDPDHHGKQWGLDKAYRTWLLLRRAR